MPVINAGHAFGQTKADCLQKLYEAETDPKEKLRKLNSLAWDIAFYDLKKGLELAKKGLEESKKINFPEGQLRFHNTLATIYQDLGDYDISLENHLAGLEIAEKIGEKKFLGPIYSNLASLYKALQDTANTRKYMENALTAFLETGHENGISVSYHNLAIRMIESGNFDPAEKFIGMAQKFNYKNDWKHSIGNNIMLLGQIRVKQGRLKEAADYFHSAMKLLRDAGREYELVQAYVNLCELEDKIPPGMNAEEYCKKGLELAQKLQIKSYVVEAAKQLSEINEQRGNTRDALKYYKLSQAVKDSVFNESKKQKIDNLTAQYEIKSKEQEIQILKAEKKVGELENEKQREQLNKQRLAIGGGIVLLLSFGIFSFLLFRQNKAKQKANEALALQKALVQEKNKEILDSILYAKRLQDAILPSPEALKSAFPEHFLFYLPKDVVAGDFYWISDKSSEKNKGFKYFAVADCTGHGVPGALVSIVCNNALNRSVDEFKLTTPGSILEKTRELVIKTFEDSGRNVKDGMDISLAAFDSEKGEVLWAGANTGFLYFPPGKSEFLEIKGDKQPIGSHDKPKPFTTHTLSLEKGSAYYFFTDGITDQFGGDKKKKLKAKNFRDFLQTIRPLSPEHQRLEIEKFLASWKGDLEQVDDICVAGLFFP